jgi:hypothetical protein
MGPELQATLVGSAVAVISGALGYAFREWRNRAKPFIAVTKFTGDVRISDSETAVPSEVSDVLAPAFYLDQVADKVELGRINQLFDEGARMLEHGPVIRRRIDAIVSAIANNTPDATLVTLLIDLCGPSYMDEYFGHLLARDRVRPKPTEQPAAPKFSAHYSEQNDGCIVVGFPNRPITLGMGFKTDEFMKARFEPLVVVIQNLDRPALVDVLARVREQIGAEEEIALKLRPELQRILDANSRWESYIYLANLRSTPMLIEPTAVLHVRDYTGATFAEVCKMAVYGEDSKRQRRFTADSPLVVPSGVSSRFTLFTKNTQNEMSRGQAFRDAFVHNQALAWLELYVHGVGLRRRVSVTTPKYTFSAEPIAAPMLAGSASG